MDKKLDKILDTYVVAGADKALLEKVVLHIQEQQSVPAKRFNYLYAAMFSTLALFGFWMGNASLVTASTQTALQDKYITQSILGPSKLSDFLL